MNDTVITHNRRRSRLSTLIDLPGGISTGAALRHASENLAAMEERSLGCIEEAISKLSELGAPDTIKDSQIKVHRAYDLSSSILDSAGPFGRDDICKAAVNLCDLLDAASEEEIFDWRIVIVHCQTFKLLMSLPADQTAVREQILDSLKDVLRIKVGNPDAI